MKNKAFGTLVVALLIGGLIGFGGGYMYNQNAAEAAWQEGVAYQQSVTPQQYYSSAASLDFEWSDDAGEFDHSATVDGDGNVAADVDVELSLTIMNDDEDNDAEVWIVLYNPKTDKDGLDSDLELDETKISMEVGGISKLTLYKDGEYTDGVEIGTIPAGAEAEVTITVTLLEHDDEDYPDGKTLDCELFVWQPNADTVDVVDFTVLT